MELSPIGKEVLPVNPMLAKIIGMTRPKNDTFEIPFGDDASMTFRSVNNHAVLEQISAKVELFLKVASKNAAVPAEFRPYLTNNKTALAACAALAATIIEPPTSELEFMVMYSEAPLVFRFINEEWAKYNNGLATIADGEGIEEAKKDSVTSDTALG